MPGQYLKTFFSVAISLLILQLHSFAQDKVRYGGYVADPDGYFPVTGASVALIHGSDTLYTTTDKYGGFAIENAPAGNATISITHILYKPVEKKTLIKNGHPDFFYMEKGENTLQSSKVTASVPVITVKGDTLVYNVAATGVAAEGDMLRDVLAKLPGIDPQNMNILGKAIARTYINDRLIFGDNPQDAMKYLSGREIINISVYDEDSPEDRGRKFKRKEKERVINVKTRHRIDFIYAGHATASYGRNMKNAGDGTDNRYTAGLAGNFFSEKLQLKANASADNTGRDSDPDRILDITGLNPDYARDMKADIEAVKKFSLPALNRLGISYGYSNA